MGDRSKIEWTDATWNPIRARHRKTGKRGWFCEKVSAGCANCYAARRNENLYFGNGVPYAVDKRDQVELYLDEEVLLQPLRWRRERMIFPCSMTDLFAEFVPDVWIDLVLGVMAQAWWHTFQVTTKRPERMLAYFRGLGPGAAAAERLISADAGLGCIWEDDAVCQIGNAIEGVLGKDAQGDRNVYWPLRNLWLGVSVEDQKTANARIPLLLQTPAAVRWVSAEPLLGPIDLNQVGCTSDSDPGYSALTVRPDDEPVGSDEFDATLDWVVVGGESGPGARPMHPEWARALRDQCGAAGVAFFFKQWGEWAPGSGFVSNDVVCRDCGARLPFDGLANARHPHNSYAAVQRVGKNRAGRKLDGREWNEYPTPQTHHGDTEAWRA